MNNAIITLISVLIVIIILTILNKWLKFAEFKIETVHKHKKKENSFKSIYESKNQFKGYDSSK